jgi:hypothetical protein
MQTLKSPEIVSLVLFLIGLWAASTSEDIGDRYSSLQELDLRHNQLAFLNSGYLPHTID